MKYKTLKKILTSLIAGYILYVNLVYWLDGNVEKYFPFFAYSLFSHIPSDTVQFEILITQVDDRPLNEPLPFTKASRYFDRAQDIALYFAVQELGRALIRNNNEEEQEARQFLEAELGRKHQMVSYRVVSAQVDALKWWKDRQLTYTALKDFEMRRQLP